MHTVKHNILFTLDKTANWGQERREALNLKDREMHTGVGNYCALPQSLHFKINRTFSPKLSNNVVHFHSLEGDIICVMLYSMCAQISAICTNDFFQEHASQSLQEKGCTFCALFFLLPKNYLQHKTRSQC